MPSLIVLVPRGVVLKVHCQDCSDGETLVRRKALCHAEFLRYPPIVENTTLAIFSLFFNIPHLNSSLKCNTARIPHTEYAKRAICVSCDS